MSDALQLSDELPTSERRRYVRQNVLFSSAELEKGNGGIILNICEGGVALHVVSEVADCELSNLRFQFALTEPWIETKGRIVWRSHSRKTVGVQFVDLPDSARGRIKSWISEANELVADNPESEKASGEELSLRPGKAAAETSAATVPENAWRKIRVDIFDESATSTVHENLTARRLRHRKRYPRILSMIVAGGTLLLAGIGYFSRWHTGNQRSTPEIRSATTGGVLPGSPGTSSVPSSPQAAHPGPSAHNQSNPYGFVLQVGAMKDESNALVLADQVRQKNFSVFVSKSPGSNFFRVLVGPYADANEAAKGEAELKNEGFSSIRQKNSPSP